MNPRELANYKRTQIETATPLQLLVMLYDGAMNEVQRARDAIGKGDVQSKGRAVDKSLAILGELQASLNMEEGGDIAPSLDALYTYMCEQVVDASVRMDGAPLDQVLGLLGTLRGAWQEISQKPASEMAGNAPRTPSPGQPPAEAATPRISITT